MAIWLILSLCLIGFFVCGCPCACIACFDQFTRADGTDITTGSPCGWTEAAGSWEIASNKLRTASTNAIARGDTIPASGKNRVLVDFQVPGDGDIVRAIVDYVDASNFHFVECKVHPTSPLGYLRLYNKIGGVDTQLATDDTLQLNSGSAVYSLEVCVNQAGTFISANVKQSGILKSSVSAAYSTLGGTYVGIGTGGTVSGNIDFDNASLSDSCPGGAQCAPLRCDECVDNNITRTMKVVLAGIANNACTTCGNFNATYYPERPFDPASNCSLIVQTVQTCGMPPLAWTLFVNVLAGNAIKVWLNSAFVQEIIWLDATASGDTDCDELLDRSVPYSSTTAINCIGGAAPCCAGAASTCLVSAF